MCAPKYLNQRLHIPKNNLYLSVSFYYLRNSPVYIKHLPEYFIVGKIFQEALRVNYFKWCFARIFFFTIRKAFYRNFNHCTCSSNKSLQGRAQWSRRRRTLCHLAVRVLRQWIFPWKKFNSKVLFLYSARFVLFV